MAGEPDHANVFRYSLYIAFLIQSRTISRNRAGLYKSLDEGFQHFCHSCVPRECCFLLPEVINITIATVDGQVAWLISAYLMKVGWSRMSASHVSAYRSGTST